MVRWKENKDAKPPMHVRPDERRKCENQSEEGSGDEKRKAGDIDAQEEKRHKRNQKENTYAQNSRAKPAPLADLFDVNMLNFSAVPSPIDAYAYVIVCTTTISLPCRQARTKTEK